MASKSGLCPVVSIVMSCFNDEQHVEQAVSSIQGQSLTNWELIAINDGSSDRTGAILDRLAADDSRIRVIHQTNAGLTASLIRGCQTARAEFIARHDADDVSHHDRLRLQVELLSSDSNLGFVSCFADYVGPAGEFLSSVTRNPDSTKATDELLNHRVGPPAHGTVMFRKEIYEKAGSYRWQFYYAQDSDLWLRMAEVSQIAYVNTVLYSVRWRPEGITGTDGSIQRGFGELGQKCRQARRQGKSESPWLIEAASLRELAVAERTQPRKKKKAGSQASMKYQLGSQLVKNRDRRAIPYLLDVIRCWPWHWRAWVRLGQCWLTGQRRQLHNPGESR